MSEEPLKGDIWREVDPRFNRYIRIHETPLPDDLRVVFQTVVNATDTLEWTAGKNSGLQSARRERFNGRRGGYTLYQRPTPKSAGNEPPIAPSLGPPSINDMLNDFIEYKKLRDDGDMRSWAADRLHDDLGYCLRLLGASIP